MRFTLDTAGDANTVRAYSAQELRIGERRFERALLVGARWLVEEIEPQQLADLRVSDLEPLLGERPQVVLFGGEGGIAALDPAVRRALLARGIGVEVMDLGAACRTYNVLLAEGREVAAALFPRKAT